MASTRTCPSRSQICDSKKRDEHVRLFSSLRGTLVRRMYRKTMPPLTGSMIGSASSAGTAGCICSQELAVAFEAMGEPPETPGYALLFNEESGWDCMVALCSRVEVDVEEKRFAKRWMGVVLRRRGSSSPTPTC